LSRQVWITLMKKSPTLAPRSVLKDNEFFRCKIANFRACSQM